MKKNDLVLPGDKLTMAEEYLPGKNTFEDGEGNIKAEKIGKAVFDEENREVMVESKQGKVNLQRGAVVYGTVERTAEKFALIKMQFGFLGGQPVTFQETRGRLSVTNASNAYTKSMADEFKIGDFVKAKVDFASKFAVDLSTKGAEFGVVKGFCSACRKPLHLNGSKLACTNCKQQNHRMTSSDYGKEFVENEH